jgi:hypothetical protein
MTLHALSPEAMTTYSDRLSALFGEGNAFREIWRIDGMAWTKTVDVKGMISPDNLNQVINQINKRVRNSTSTLHASNSYRVTRRSQ